MSEGQTLSPKRVLLTTIGIGPLNEVPYIIDGKVTEKSPYFPYLLAKSLMPGLNDVFVLVTPEAKVKHWEKDKQDQPLKVSLKSLGLNAKEIDIPKGTNEEEIWKIFSEIYAKVDEGVDLYLDVTHGFRHLPMIMLAACMYLRKAKNVKVQGIYYGALDAKPKESEDPRPALNLLPFVMVLDWAEGLSAFQRMGDVGILATIFRGDTNDQLQSLTPVKELRESIRNMYTGLFKLAGALDLARPIDILDAADKLQNSVLRTAIKETKDIPPISRLFSQIDQEIGLFAMDRGIKDEKKVLQRQAHLIRWLAGRDRLFAAQILTREWLISWVMWQLGASYDEIFSNTNFCAEMGLETPRQIAERLINETVNLSKGDPINKKQERNQKIAAIISDLWSKVANLRNNLAHAGYRKEPKLVGALQTEIRKHISEVFGDQDVLGRVNLETLEIKPAEKKPTQGQDSQ